MLRGAWWRQWGWITVLVSVGAVTAVAALAAGAPSTVVANIVTSAGVVLSLILTVRADRSAASRSEAAASHSQDNSESVVAALQEIASAARAGAGPSPPRPKVRWSLRWESGDRYILVNIGDALARDVEISAHESLQLIHITRSGSDMAPDEALTFLTVLTFGTTDSLITVTWRDDGVAEATGRRTWRYPLPGKPRR